MEVRKNDTFQYLKHEDCDIKKDHEVFKEYVDRVLKPERLKIVILWVRQLIPLPAAQLRKQKGSF